MNANNKRFLFLLFFSFCIHRDYARKTNYYNTMSGFISSSSSSSSSSSNSNRAFVVSKTRNNNNNHNNLRETNNNNDRIIDDSSSATTAAETKPSLPQTSKNKRIVFIRHGCTYMNEYLGETGKEFGEPNFTDVFERDEKPRKYQDSPLSPVGVHQAKTLGQQLGGGDDDNTDNGFRVSELDLVVVSPLTRAIQTCQLGLLPHIGTTRNNNKNKKEVPIVALPYAAERLYLISDVGRLIPEMKKEFPFVDFDSGMEHNNEHKTKEKKSANQEHPWWFTVKGGDDDYKEWRPSGQGQTYACPGEPQDVFDERMNDLYDWLSRRPESTIAVVSHWGVIQWMTGEDFENCQVRVFPLDSIPPRLKNYG